MNSLLNKLGLSLCVAIVLGACSSQQIYASGQTWQRNECQKLNDKSERDRCLADSNTSYDNYKKQTDNAKKD